MTALFAFVSKIKRCGFLVADDIVSLGSESAGGFDKIITYSGRYALGFVGQGVGYHAFKQIESEFGNVSSDVHIDIILKKGFEGIKELVDEREKKFKELYDSKHITDEEYCVRNANGVEVVCSDGYRLTPPPWRGR